MCSAAAVKDIPKDACVDLTEAGVDAQVAAAQGDAAAAYAANFKIVGTLFASGIKSADFEPFTAKTVTETIHAGLAALGPSTCATTGIAKDISKEHCLSLLIDGIKMAMGDDAAGVSLVQTMLAANVSESTIGAITKSSIGLTADQVVLAGAKAVVADGAVGQALGAVGNYEKVGAVALTDAAMLENALVDQCGANFLPCLFDDSDAVTSKVVGDLVVPSLSPFERMGAICTVAPSACSAHVTDQCGANFIPCLFDDATYGAAAIQSAIPLMTELELMGAVCTADAASCTNYVLDQCAAFAPCLFADATYGPGVRAAGVPLMSEFEKLGSLCAASSATCEAGFAAVGGLTVMCYVNDADPYVAGAAELSAIAGMTTGQRWVLSSQPLPA